MIIEIDQSGKVENTSVQTVLADSIGNSYLLSAKDKRAIQQFYRLQNRPRMYVLDVFAIILAYLIEKSYASMHMYEVDIEYEGREDEILSMLLESLSQLDVSIHRNQIRFRCIGKKSAAHTLAYKVYTGKLTGKKLKIKDILCLFRP